MSKRIETFAELRSAINDILTPDMKSDILILAGTSVGRAASICNKYAEFWAQLEMQMAFSENHVKLEIWKNYPGIQALIYEYLGQENPNKLNETQLNLETKSKLVQVPTSLKEALDHPEFIPIFAKLFLKMNSINPNNNLKGWQNLLNIMVNLNISKEINTKLYNGSTKNPSEELVTFIAKTTETSLEQFCQIIENDRISLNKYSQKIRTAVQKCQNQFKDTANQITNDNEKIISWCNKQGLSRLIPIFQEQGIDTLDVIKSLNESDLNDLGIKLMGDRKKVMAFINELNGKHSNN